MIDAGLPTNRPRFFFRMLTVEVVGFRVLYIDCNRFPIGLALINHGKDPEHLNSDDFPTGAHLDRTLQLALHFCCHYYMYVNNK